MKKQLQAYWRAASCAAHAAWHTLLTSRLFQHAALSLALAFFSRAVGFLAMAYAARCLGPENFGISGTIFLSAAYFALLSHFGFDTVAVRQIAVQKTRVHQIAQPLLSFRALVLFALSLLWMIVSFYAAPPYQRWLWLLGTLFLWTQGLNFFFVFQGIEEMGWHYATLALQSVLSALLIFFFFSPGMPLGADLVVTSIASAAALMASIGLYAYKTRHCPFGAFSLHDIAAPLREGWRYWLLAILIFTIANAQVPLLATMVDAAEVGIYRAGYAVAMAVDFFFGSIYSLFLPRLTVWQAKGHILFWKNLTKTVWLCVFFGGGLTLLLSIGAPFIYRLLLGEAFLDSVRVFQVLMLTRFVAFVSQPYSQALIAFQKDALVLRTGLFGAALYLGLAIFTVPRYGILAMAFSSLFTETVLLGLHYGLLRHALKETPASTELPTRATD